MQIVLNEIQLNGEDDSMNEIIKIDSDNKVSGRELHEFLEVDSNFTTWF